MENLSMEKCSDCGHKAHLVHDDLGYFAECAYDFCGNTTEYFKTMKEAIEAWNKRNKPKFDIP